MSFIKFDDIIFFLFQNLISSLGFSSFSNHLALIFIPICILRVAKFFNFCLKLNTSLFNNFYLFHIVLNFVKPSRSYFTVPIKNNFNIMLESIKIPIKYHLFFMFSIVFFTFLYKLIIYNKSFITFRKQICFLWFFYLLFSNISRHIGQAF